MGHVIGMVQSKGGVGKTTTALNLAAELRRRGYSVRVLDADPAGHAAATGAHGTLPFPVDTHLIEAKAEAGAWVRAIRALSDDFVLVDAPGSMGPAYGATVAVAELVLIPAGPTALDLRGAVETVRFVREQRRARGGVPDILVVPSRVDKRTVAGREAVATLASLTEPVAPPITYRAIVADSLATGEAVPADSPSAIEFSRLADAVLTRLGVAA